MHDISDIIKQVLIRQYLSQMTKLCFKWSKLVDIWLYQNRKAVELCLFELVDMAIDTENKINILPAAPSMWFLGWKQMNTTRSHDLLCSSIELLFV